MQPTLFEFRSINNPDLPNHLIPRSDVKLKVHISECVGLDGKELTVVSRVGDGSIITRFDKTPIPKANTDVVCPHFLELKWATGCSFSCAWCYLQGTLRFLDVKKAPRPKDFERIKTNLQAFLDDNNIQNEILNAGELSDSLITETSNNPFSLFVMEEIKKRPDCKILFVTKSCNINNLLKIDNKQQAIVSFSVNATPVADRWEKGAPKVKARLNAAKKLSEAGFEVRLRIDPMVPVDGWTEAYSELIDDIFERLTPERITIGSLRGLQSTINNSPDRSWTEYLDEKSNWGRKISLNKRLEMYQLIITKLREEHQFERVALCKETVEMWQALGLDYSKIRCNCTL